ncbi:MAG: TolC family protein [Gammaproteobacteria bacterium]|nr:MAG: TolC family protein [Gammaproteobacteria bacterium]RKZ94817.1 MAG: TolC family protein [Gammaproteobacteria bacterium]
MNKIQTHSLFLAFTLSLSVTATSAETLQQAWETVINYDHSLKAVSENTAASRLQLEAEKASRLPSLLLETGYTSLDNAPATKVPSGYLQVGEKNSLSYKATASVPLYTSGRITNNIAASTESFNAFQLQELTAVQDLKLSVAESYVAVLRARKAIVVANSHVDSLKAHEQDVHNLYDQGMVPNNDLLAAQVSLADAQQEAIKVQNAFDIAQSAFNRFMGRPLEQAVILDEIQLIPVDTSLLSLTEQALKKRSELEALQKQVQVFNYRADSIRAESGPQVSLNGGYDYQENTFTAHEDQWSINVGMQWKIFDAGLIRNKASATTRQAMAVQEQYDDLANKISLQVRQFWLDVQETDKRIPVTEKAIAQAEENLKVNRDRYENGLSTNTEVIDAENLRTRSQNNKDNAIYDAVLASLRLKRATGEL